MDEVVCTVKNPGVNDFIAFNFLQGFHFPMEAHLLNQLCSLQETEEAQDPYSTADDAPQATSVRSKRPVSFSSDDEDDQPAGKKARPE